MTRWTTQVTYENVPEPPTSDQLDIIMEDGVTTPSHDARMGMLNLHWYDMEDGGNITQALASSVLMADAVMRRAGVQVGDVVRVEVYDDARPAHVDELYRYADFALFGGVSRQAVAQAARNDPDFPEVVTKLSDGTALFRPLEAIAYARKRWGSDEGE